MPTTCFLACPLVSSVVEQLIIMSLHRYLKPSVDSGGTYNNLVLLPDPNVESGESARAVVAAAKKEVIALLSGTTTLYNILTCFTCTNHEIITLLTTHPPGSYYIHPKDI